MTTSEISGIAVWWSPDEKCFETALLGSGNVINCPERFSKYRPGPRYIPMRIFGYNNLPKFNNLKRFNTLEEVAKEINQILYDIEAPEVD